MATIATLIVVCSLMANDFSPVKLPNFHQIDPNLLRGAQPTDAGLVELSRRGVKTVIDLRGGKQRSSNERVHVEQLGMQYINVPMPNMAAPSAPDVEFVLGKLNDRSAWPIFVHCRRGADRTGLIFACYRISRDHWPVDKALREANLYGMSRLQHAKKEFIRHYQPSASVPALTDVDHATAILEQSR